jgi:hypothetical protein
VINVKQSFDSSKSNSNPPNEARREWTENMVDGQTEQRKGGPNESNRTDSKLYKVIRVVPENEAHLKLLERLEMNGADLEVNLEFEMTEAKKLT